MTDYTRVLDNPARLARPRIIAISVCVLAGFLAEATLDFLLPAELKAFVDERNAAQLTNEQAVVLLVLLAYVIAAVVARIGLWRFRAWARRLITIALVLSPVVSAAASVVFPELSIDNPGSLFFSTIANGLTVMLVTLAWTGARDMFH